MTADSLLGFRPAKARARWIKLVSANAASISLPLVTVFPLEDMGSELDCIVCGNMVADIIGRPIDALVPKHNAGHTRVDQIRLFTGGFACNAASALARLGVRTGVIGRVGEDEWKNVIARTLERRGIDVSGISVDPANQTPATIVCVDSTGERTFYHAAGASRNFSAAHVREHLPLIRHSRFFALGYYGILPAMEPDLPALLQELKAECGVTTLLDTCGAVGPTLDDLAQSLPHVDFFIPSLHEATTLTRRNDPKEIVKTLRDNGARGVVGVKLGGEGCLLDDGKRSARVAALPVEQVVDTTGAGDSFLAGIIAAYLHGMDLEQMARFANAVGSCCVQALGASSGIRSFEETMKLLK